MTVLLRILFIEPASWEETPELEVESNSESESK